MCKDYIQLTLPFNKHVENHFYHLYSLSDSMHREGFLSEQVQDTVGVGSLFATLQQKSIATGYG